MNPRTDCRLNFDPSLMGLFLDSIQHQLEPADPTLTSFEPSNRPSLVGSLQLSLLRSADLETNHVLNFDPNCSDMINVRNPKRQSRLQTQLPPTHWETLFAREERSISTPNKTANSTATQIKRNLRTRKIDFKPEASCRLNFDPRVDRW